MFCDIIDENGNFLTKQKVREKFQINIIFLHFLGLTNSIKNHLIVRHVYRNHKFITDISFHGQGFIQERFDVGVMQSKENCSLFFFGNVSRSIARESAMILLATDKRGYLLPLYIIPLT